MRTAIAIVVFILAHCFSAHAQKARLDSLQRVLKNQPKANAERLRTLTALAKTCATIDPNRAVGISKEATQLARTLKDEKGLALAWASQRWVYYCMSEFQVSDSLGHAIQAVAERTRDPLLIGLNTWVYGTEDPTDSTQLRIIRERSERAIAALRSTGDRALLAEGLWRYGVNTRFHQDANSLLEALALFRSVGDSSGVGICLTSLNYYEPFASDAEGSLARIERAVELFEQDGNVMCTIWMRTYLIWYYLERTDYVKAARNARFSLDAAERLGLPDELSAAESALGDVYLAIGDHRLALDHHLRGLGHRATMLDHRLNSLNSIGRIYRLFGMPDSARYYLDRALKENPYSGDEHRNAETRGFLAELLAQQDSVVRAAELFNAALEVHRKRASNYMQEVYFSLGLGRMLAGADAAQLVELGLSSNIARAQAIQLLEHAAELGGEQHMLKEQQDALYQLAQLYEDAGQVSKAFEYQKRYLVLQDSVNNDEKTKAVVRLESAYEEEQRNKALRAEQAAKDAEAQAELSGQKLLRNWLGGGAVVIALFAGVFLYQRNRVKKAKARSDEILYNVLPQEVAEEIRKTGGAQSREIDQVSILFTDFKGFTELSARISRQELMNELNACFQTFDGIIGRHGVEKIKTIGDSYMAAAGLKGNAAAGAMSAVKAALEMQAFIEARKAERDQMDLPAFQMRVGIHTGPVVAGIVGVKKFQYDIWGDTVNTASRMESSGEVGQVNISEATYRLVVGSQLSVVSPDGGSPTTDNQHLTTAPAFTFTPRGKVQAKGKGEMEMYFVEHT